MSTNRILSRSVAALLALTPIALRAGIQTIVASGDPTDGSPGVNPSWGIGLNWTGTSGAVLPGINDLAQISSDEISNTGVDIRGNDFVGGITEVAGISFVGSSFTEVDLENNSTDTNMTLSLNGGGGTVPLIQTGGYAVTIAGVGLGAVTPTTKTLTLQLKGSGDFSVGDGGLTITATITSTGAFGFNKTGTGLLTIGGSAANTYTGTTTISDGTLIANKPTGINAIGGNLVINAGGTFMYQGNNVGNQIADGATITLNGGTFGDNAQGTPTNPGAPEKVTSVIVNSGNFSTGRALFTTTGLFSDAGGTTLVHRGGSLAPASFSLSNGGVVNLDGGSTTAGAESKLNVGAGGMNLSGGTINFDYGISGLTTTSTGSILNLGGNVTATGETDFVHLNPGTVGPKANVELGTSARTFNVSGTLNIGAVGAPVNVNGGSPGAGSIIKTGAGTLSINGSTHSLSGPVMVNAGTLLFTGNFATTAPVIVANGAKFGGAGNVPALVTVNNGGTLQPGDVNGVGTLTASTLKFGLAAGDTATLNLTTSSLINVTGAGGLTSNGGANSVTINMLGTIPGAGDFTIIDYASPLVINLNIFKLAPLPSPRMVGSILQNTQNTTIYLHTVADFPVWTGALSSEWSTATLAAPKNWVLNSNNATTTDFLASDSVGFSDVGTNTNVDLSVADVSPSSVTFSNATKNYTLTGSKAITGSTGLTKSGAGTTTIGTTNTFTGAVALNGGTVSVGGVADSGSASPLGMGTTITFNGGTLEFTGAAGSTNRSITLTGTGGTVKTTGASLALTGVLSGSGPLAKTGAGTLVLGGATANTNSGLTTVSEGTLVANKPAGTNAIGASLTIQGTGAFMYSGNNVSNQIPDSATITVNGGTFGDPVSANPTPSGATDTVGTVSVAGGTFNSGRNPTPFTIGNTLTVSSGTALVQRGGGISAKTVTFTGGSLNLDGGGTNPGEASKLIVGAGGLTLGGSTIDLNAGPSTISAGSMGSVVTLNGNVTSTGTSSLTRLNPGLSSASVDLGGGARTFNVAGTLDIGSAAAPVTLLNGSIVKTGAGVLTLSGAQSSTSLTNNGGTLRLSASTSLAALNLGDATVTQLTAHGGSPGNVKAIDTPTLSFTGSAKLDLTNNAMVVRGGNYATLRGKVISGFDGGLWDGPGINSSTAAGDANGRTGIAIVNNADAGFTDFAGVTGLTGNEVLFKYTYYGDADLSGTVTSDDFSLFLDGYNGVTPASWLSGDFDYSGTVTSDDFSLFLDTYNNLGAPLRDVALADELNSFAEQLAGGGDASGGGDAAGGAAVGAQAVVPEPGAAGLLTVGALGLLARRRRR